MSPPEHPRETHRFRWRRPWHLSLSWLALGLGLLFAFGDTPSTNAQAKLVVKIGTGDRADAPLGVLMESIARELEARAEQRLVAKRFPDRALGASRPALERVEAGDVQAYVASFAELTSFMPALTALSSPLLFGSVEDLEKRREASVTKAIEGALARRGIALATLGPCESRVLTSVAPLRRNTLSALHVREPGSASARALFAALNSPALSVPEGDPELADMTLEALIAKRATRWVRHVTSIDHALECSAVVYSQRWLDGLPAALQRRLREPPEQAVAQAREARDALQNQLLAALERMDIEIQRRAPRLRRTLAEPARTATQELIRDLGADAARIVAAARR